MGCAGCAMHKGPQQSEGPLAIWWAPAICRRAPRKLKAPSVWGTQQSEGPFAIWGASAIWGAPATQGQSFSNLGTPATLGPRAIWVQGPWELRTVAISLKFSCDAVNEVNHFRNCSLTIMLCQLHSLCTAFMLLLKLPVTVATYERSFSKLKLIKNHLRKTMSVWRTVERPGNVVNWKSTCLKAWHLKCSRHVCAWEGSQTNILTFQNCQILLSRHQTWPLFDLLHCFFQSPLLKQTAFWWRWYTISRQKKNHCSRVIFLN